MTKARNLSKIIDGSGNLVVTNAGGNARSLGMVKADGTPIDALDRATTSANIAVGNCSGYMPSNCNGATNPLDIDPAFNTTTTYENATGSVVNNNVDVKRPRNGEWWTWTGFGFSGIPTSNCQNMGAYDGVGGFSQSFNAIPVDDIFSGYSTTDELGGTYQSRTVNNCNCGSFNCRTNCNCNCACACDCACGNG